MGKEETVGNPFVLENTGDSSHSPALSGDTLFGKGCPWMGATHLQQLSYPPQGNACEVLSLSQGL